MGMKNSSLFRRVLPRVRFVEESRDKCLTEGICAVSAIFEHVSIFVMPNKDYGYLEYPKTKSDLS